MTQAAVRGPRAASAPIIAVAIAMAMIGIALVGASTSLPRIIASLGGTNADYAAAITASLLASALAIPVWGSVADRVSRKALLLMALALIVLASLCGGAASGTVMLTVARAVQGIGIGGIMALAPMIIGGLVPVARRSSALALLGATTSVSIALAPVLCGFATDVLGWRWMFVGIAAAAVLAMASVGVLGRDDGAGRRGGRFDFGGLTLIGLALSAMMTAFGTFRGAVDALPWVLLGAAAVLLVCAVIVERRATSPIVPVALFQYRGVALAVTISLLSSVAIFGAGVFIVQYLQLALGLSVASASAMLIPQVAGTAVVALLVGAVVKRSAVAWPWIATGTAVAALAMVALSVFRHEVGPGIVAAVMLAFGMGVGAVQQNLMLTAQASAPAEDLAGATATNAFAGSVGGVFGASGLAAFLQARLSAVAERSPSSETTSLIESVPDLTALSARLQTEVQGVYESALGDVFLAMAIALALAAVLAALLPRARLFVPEGAAPAKVGGA